MISTQVSPELSPFAVEANAQKLVTLLAVLGFSIDSVAERRGNKLLVTFIGAANCWGLRSLSQGNPLARPPLVNDFGAKVVGAWLARCGYAGSREPAATTFDAAKCAYTHEFRLACVVRVNLCVVLFSRADAWERGAGPRGTAGASRGRPRRPFRRSAAAPAPARTPPAPPAAGPRRRAAVPLGRGRRGASPRTSTPW